MNISQRANLALGDTSGRSISRTIGDGLSMATGGTVSGRAATDVAHAAMVVAAVAPVVDNRDGAKVAGGIALFLGGAYLFGRWFR